MAKIWAGGAVRTDAPANAEHGRSHAHRRVRACVHATFPGSRSGLRRNQLRHFSKGGVWSRAAASGTGDELLFDSHGLGFELSNLFTQVPTLWSMERLPAWIVHGQLENV